MRILFVFGIMLVSAMIADTRLSADGKPPPKPTLPKGTPAEQVKELIAEHEKAITALRWLYKAAKTEEEREKLVCVDPQPYARLLLDIAEKNPKEDCAVDALIWAYRHARSPKAKAILLRDHLLHPKIGSVCMPLRHDHDPAILAAFKKILAENTNKESQAQAAVALGMQLRGNAAVARAMRKPGSTPADLEKNFGKELFALLAKADPEALEKEAESLFERVVKDKTYAETTIPVDDERLTLGNLAGRELFEMRYLQPGKVAPDIVGEDIDGKPMKLSDFRGKVVLLDFWAFW
jgi:hypothetical protein